VALQQFTAACITNDLILFEHSSTFNRLKAKLIVTLSRRKYKIKNKERKADLGVGGGTAELVLALLVDGLSLAARGAALMPVVARNTHLRTCLAGRS
jgi:hypothetical protein